MSIALGNNKPEALLEVETIIWRALFVISQGMQLPEDVVEQLLPQIPWEKLTSESAQRNWFDIRASPSPTVLACPIPDILTQTVPPVSAPQPLLALTRPDPMDISPNHAVQIAVHNPEDVDTDRNELRSTDELTCGRAESGNMVQDARTPLESSLKESNGPPDLQSYRTTGEDVAPTEAVSENITMGKGGCLTSGTKGTPDGPQPESQLESQLESPGVGEDSETFSPRRSTRLSSKGKAEEGGPEHGTSRSFSPRKRQGNLTNPKQMTPENGSPGPPVASKSVLKRKVPPEIEELLSGGSSAVKPIDVDAINAVLERFPVKREQQVCNFKFSMSKCPIFCSM